MELRARCIERGRRIRGEVELGDDALSWSVSVVVVGEFC